MPTLSASNSAAGSTLPAWRASTDTVIAIPPSTGAAQSIQLVPKKDRRRSGIPIALKSCRACGDSSTERIVTRHTIYFRCPVCGAVWSTPKDGAATFGLAITLSILSEARLWRIDEAFRREMDGRREKSGIVRMNDQVASQLMQQGFDQARRSDLYGPESRAVRTDSRFQVAARCQGLTLVKATLSLSSPGVLGSVEVEAVGVPLMRSAFNASHGLLVQAAEEKVRKEKEAAQKRVVPKV